ncbi:unnamed protein product [Ectocarpus sp. 4 AP-2014]
MSARTFSSYCAGGEQLPTPTSTSSFGQAEAPCYIVPTSGLCESEIL